MKRMILAVTERTQCRIAVYAAMVAASVVFPSFGEDGKDTADGGNVLVEKRAKPLEWLFSMGDATPHEGMAFADGVTDVLSHFGISGGKYGLKLSSDGRSLLAKE